MNQLRLKGYVHDVSPTKRSRGKSFPYFNFSLQVEATLKRRGVCYDSSKQQVLKGYEESREPVSLYNIAEKRSIRDASEKDVILNKRSRVEAANNNDIAFEYQEDIPAPAQQLTEIENITTLEEDELTSVKGTLTLRAESVQKVLMKDGLLVDMLDRCTVTDNTGTIRLTLWGSTIEEVTNNRCYKITDVRVKLFNSVKYLTTTPGSEFTTVDERFDPPTQEFFNSLFDAETIHVSKIHLADNYKTWLSCTKCGKQISDVTSTANSLMKCPNCNVVHPVSSCTLSASVRIQVRGYGDPEPTWLKVFTSVLETMLQHDSSDVTLESPEEDVYSQLFLLKDFAIDYNEQSLIVEDIHFES